MTSSGEMSPAMMAMPGICSALVGVLRGVFLSALLTSLTPRWSAPAFRAAKKNQKKNHTSVGNEQQAVV